MNEKNNETILIYGFIGSTASIVALGFVLFEYFNFEVSINAFALIFSIIALILITIFAAGLYRAKTKVVFSQSQNSLFQSYTSPQEQMKDAKAIDLLGGTFKSFTDKEKNILGLKDRLTKNSQVRILMLHPKGTGVKEIVKTRKSRYEFIDTQTISREIIDSIKRFGAVLEIENLEEVIRLYEVASNCSIYKFDENYILTNYTYGRGASSPAVFMKKSKKTKDYCASLDRGINELWNAPSTKKLSREILKELKIIKN